MILGAELSKLETGVTQVGREKLSMMGPGLDRPTTTLERVVTLISWLQLHLTK